jgi:outer membrane protein assembly factor BamB
MTVIDLSRVDPPAASRPRRRPDWRRLVVAAVAVCCVLTVTGSARPDPRGLAQLWDVPFSLETDSYQLSGDVVHVLGTSGERRLTAYDSRTGAVRWSIAAGDLSDLSGIAAGALLTRGAPDGSTVALDSATGRRLWRLPGDLVTVLGDRAVLLEVNGTGEQARRIRMVRMADGGTVWSRDLSGTIAWTTDRADRLLTVTARGRAEMITLADGAVVTTGTVPWPALKQAADRAYLTLQGRQLFQDRAAGGRTTVTAYDAGTLRQLWTIDQPSGGSFDCGAVVCIMDGESISGHDRATGARLWRLPRASTAFALPGGRLLAEEGRGSRHPVLDGTTGRRLADLGRGEPVWDPRGHLTYLIAGTRQPSGRTSVSSVDPVTAEVVLRGTVAPAQQCRSDRGLLTCVTDDNRLTVTDVG